MNPITNTNQNQQLNFRQKANVVINYAIGGTMAGSMFAVSIGLHMLGKDEYKENAFHNFFYIPVSYMFTGMLCGVIIGISEAVKRVLPVAPVLPVANTGIRRKFSCRSQTQFLTNPSRSN